MRVSLCLTEWKWSTDFATIMSFLSPRYSTPLYFRYSWVGSSTWYKTSFSKDTMSDYVELIPWIKRICYNGWSEWWYGGWGELNPVWARLCENGLSNTKREFTSTSSTDTVCLRVLGLPWPTSLSISKLHLSFTDDSFPLQESFFLDGES